MINSNPNYLLNTVASLNCVDAYLLAEDDKFIKLVREIIESGSSYAKAIEWLCAYVQDNY